MQPETGSPAVTHTFIHNFSSSLPPWFCSALAGIHEQTAPLTQVVSELCSLESESSLPPSLPHTDRQPEGETGYAKTVCAGDAAVCKGLQVRQ